MSTPNDVLNIYFENYHKMLDFIETVAAGNTEIGDLERQARNILDSLPKSRA